MGNRGKGETPEELAPRRLSFLPTESECPQRNGTGLCKIANHDYEYSCFRNSIFVLSQSLINEKYKKAREKHPLTFKFYLFII